MAFQFVNADLEITSNADLEVIKAAFARYGHRFADMYCGRTGPDRYLASFEVHPDDGRDDQTAQEKIHAFCDAILEFEGASHDLWNHALKRVIDLGYETDDHCKPFKDTLSVDTLQRMASLNIDLAITLYPQTIQQAEQGGEGGSAPLDASL